ncbi:MAG: hypothetical protein ACQKBV_03780 [Puniceicoccales bacterium]
MMKPLACITLLIAATAHGAGEFIEVLPSYRVVGVLAVSDRPAEAILERTEDGQLFQACEGSLVDSYQVRAIYTHGGQMGAELERTGVRYRVAMKQREGAPFDTNALNLSFREGYIDRKGRLTRLGVMHIQANLHQISTVGQYLIGKEPSRRVMDVRTILDKAKGRSYIGAPADPFASPQSSSEVIEGLLASVAGEDYHGVIVSAVGGKLSVTTHFGETVSIDY